MRLACPLALTLLLAGCPADPGGADLGGDGGGSGDGPAAAEDVTGSAVDTYVTAAGELRRPRDLRQLDVGALVPEGGSFRRIDGVGSMDGSFRIPNVPRVAYLLKLGSDYFYTAARAVDISVAALGRPDRSRSQQIATSVAINLDKMAPWQVGDGLALFAFNVGAHDASTERFVPGGVPTGATTLAVNVPWRRIFGPFLIDAAKGDRLQILHLMATISDNGVLYHGLGQIHDAQAFSLAEGGQAQVSGSFTAVPVDRTTRLHWRRSQLEALRTAVNPAAVSFGHMAQLVAYPGAAVHGDYGAGALLAALYPEPRATDLDVGEMKYGDPFPAAWTRVSATVASYFVTYQLPGAEAGLVVGNIITIQEERQAAAGPVGPLVGPVTAPRINGKDAFNRQQGVGLQPTLSWSAPTVGTAGGYQVLLYRLFNDGGFTRHSLVATLRTTGTTLPLPPNLLERGNTYTATILSVHRPNSDLDGRPLRKSLPEGTAAALLDTFTP